MRNSVNCNLLIFDEIFDGSLDTNGTDEFLKIMWNMLEDTNTFVISHKDTILDKFERVYRFKKKGNFSMVV
jgi:DNA repair exonuclease SbcCD ATPase subunit